MGDTSDSNKPQKSHRKSLVARCALRLFRHLKRYFDEKRAKREEEDPAIKAARSTARATVAIAAFTVALAVVGWLQYEEVIDSGAGVDRMNRIYRSQTAQLNRQASETQSLAEQTKSLADRMKDQADQTKVIARQAITQANAAKSAAETANKAMHISERAYISIGLPILDTATKYITVPVLNTGHIPSGKVVGTIHEITLDGIVPTTARSSGIHASEAHWKSYELVSVPTTGQTMNFNVAVPALNTDSLNTGHEEIVVVGIISYNDGFSDDPAQQWSFCEGSALLPPSKNLQWGICDPAMYLPQAIKADRYPDNEYPN
jgi:hypothetical protein